MEYVYALTHFYEDEEGYDIVTDIATYSTKEKAVEAMERLKKHPKFISHPDDFNIDTYELDKCFWTEGFTTY